MKYLYFKQDGTLWIKAKAPSTELDAEFSSPVVVEDDYDTMIADSSIVVEAGMPTARREKTRSEIESELTYATKRKAEYPPITDYLDGVVKGDQAQIQAYIDACNAVKAKYPKGTA
jgi:hypothetical protein